MDSIRFKNYRCFSDTGEISLKPLTFLLGANSSGKSSFLEFFPLLKQSVGVRRNGIFLWYANEVDFKDFGNAVKTGEDKMQISWSYNDLEYLGYRLNNRVKQVLREANLSVQKVQIRLSMTLSARKDKFDKLDELTIEFNDVAISVLIHTDGIITVDINNRRFSSSSYGIRLNDTTFLLPRPIMFFKNKGDRVSAVYSRVLDNESILDGEDMKDVKEFIQYDRMVYLSKDEYLSFFRGITNNKDLDYEYLRDLYLFARLDDIIESINYRILAEANQLSYVKPLRVLPERYYRYQNYSVDEIDSDGKNLAMFLANLSETELKNYQAWTNNHFGFKIYPIKHEGHIELTIGKKKTEARNLVDVGFGYTQLLPIITIIWNALRGGGGRSFFPRVGNASIIIAIEQPELHLHPHVQAEFAEMLARVVEHLSSNVEVRFIIETHSEAIINRIGSLVQSGEVSSEKVKVILFNGGNDTLCNSVVETEFDQDGYLEKWPLGFLS